MMDWQTTAFLFPGQGSQAVGMGAEIAAQYPIAHALYEQADAILGIPLSQMCFEGPESELNETENTQPALFVTSLAILRALQTERDVQPAMVAGHSLGEITALVAAGAIEFEHGLRLVRERGRLMAEAGEQSPGAMAAILGLDVETLRAVCAEASAAVGKPLVVANDNCPGQIVISGDSQALDFALPLAQAQGAKRTIKLAVSVAAHSPLMAYAETEFKQVIARTPITTPHIPIVGNIHATFLTEIDDIRTELSGQLTSAVRWTETIQMMRVQGISTFVELGTKAVLKGLLKKIDREAIGLSLEKPADFAEVLQG